MAIKKIDKRKIIKSIPECPGIYKFYDKNNNIIYIGKAKNIKKRVNSYFVKRNANYKLKILVEKINNIEFIVVPTEHDALLLENNLIKKYKPKYNIQLKDDKTFPWICIKNENFPRIYSTRIRKDDGSTYFGPYTSANMVRTLLDLIRNIYPLRNCNLNLSKENINKRKFKTCLEFQIENCLGPCEGYQEENDYNSGIENIKKILKGNLKEVITYLKNEMSNYAKKYQFEKAEKIKEKIIILEKFQSKSTIVHAGIKKIDVFSISSNNKIGVINYLKITDGAIVQSHTIEIQKKLDESDKDLLLYGIIDIYQKIESQAKEILLPFHIENNFFNKTISIPKIGDKKKLLELSYRNAIQYRIEKEKSWDNTKSKSPEIRKMNIMQKDLRLKKNPNYIECFDNSNLQGTNPVSSCIVFRNAKPSKREYRHYNIRSVEGPDDYASMQEVIGRRYKRLIKEKNQLPDLIIIDGGKGQLHAAYEILKDMRLENKIAIIGIAKRLEEIFYPNDPIPLYLDKKSETLKIIQHARNEAHRFGINHHRKKRKKVMITSELDSIKGIGEKTKSILINKFNTISTIKKLGLSELEAVIDKSKAKKVYNYFKKDD